MTLVVRLQNHWMLSTQALVVRLQNHWILFPQCDYGVRCPLQNRWLLSSQVRAFVVCLQNHWTLSTQSDQGLSCPLHNYWILAPQFALGLSCPLAESFATIGTVWSEPWLSACRICGYYPHSLAGILVVTLQNHCILSARSDQDLSCPLAESLVTIYAVW